MGTSSSVNGVEILRFDQLKDKFAFGPGQSDLSLETVLCYRENDHERCKELFRMAKDIIRHQQGRSPREVVPEFSTLQIREILTRAFQARKKYFEALGLQVYGGYGAVYGPYEIVHLESPPGRIQGQGRNIYLLGERHAHNKHFCEWREGLVSVGRFIEDQIRSTRDLVDLFLETAYTPEKSSHKIIQASNSYIDDVSNRFLSCHSLAPRESLPCVFPNLRMHQTDIRRYATLKDDFFLWRFFVEMNLSSPQEMIIQDLELLLLQEKFREITRNEERLFQYMTQEHPATGKINRQLRNILNPVLANTVRDFTQAHLRMNIQNLLQGGSMASDLQQVVEDFHLPQLQALQYWAIQVSTYVMDIYLLGRLFRSYGTGPDTVNIIIYAGADHTDLYKRFFLSQAFRIMERTTPEIRNATFCVPLDSLKQPFFSPVNRRYVGLREASNAQVLAWAKDLRSAGSQIHTMGFALDLQSLVSFILGKTPVEQRTRLNREIEDIDTLATDLLYKTGPLDDLYIARRLAWSLRSFYGNGVFIDPESAEIARPLYLTVHALFNLEWVHRQLLLRGLSSENEEVTESSGVFFPESEEDISPPGSTSRWEILKEENIEALDETGVEVFQTAIQSELTSLREYRVDESEVSKQESELALSDGNLLEMLISLVTRGFGLALAERWISHQNAIDPFLAWPWNWLYLDSRNESPSRWWKLSHEGSGHVNLLFVKLFHANAMGNWTIWLPQNGGWRIQAEQLVGFIALNQSLSSCILRKLSLEMQEIRMQVSRANMEKLEEMEDEVVETFDSAEYKIWIKAQPKIDAFLPETYIFPGIPNRETLTSAGFSAFLATSRNLSQDGQLASMNTLQDTILHFKYLELQKRRRHLLKSQGALLHPHLLFDFDSSV